MSQGYTFSRAASQVKTDRLLALLATPRTRAELAAVLPASVRSVQSYLRALLAEDPRRIYVCDWRPNSPGSPSAVYALGNLPDKRRPRARTSAEIQRRHRREHPEAVLADVMRKRKARVRPHRDRLSTAFFGAA